MDAKQIAIRLLAAAFLGAVLGIEREFSRRPAGFRTHITVSVGSCLIMLISIDGFDQMAIPSDPARMAAQVVSGIGFLGAGTILHGKRGVDGLTTAATLWVSAGIGLACGVGYFVGAGITTLIGLLTLVSLRGVNKRIIGTRYERVELIFDQNQVSIANIEKDFKRNSIEFDVESITTTIIDGDKLSSAHMRVSFPDDFDKDAYFGDLLDDEKIYGITYLIKSKKL